VYCTPPQHPFANGFGGTRESDDEEAEPEGSALSKKHNSGAGGSAAKVFLLSLRLPSSV